MTEPAVASSDATNIQASIVRSEMSSCNNSASYHEQESSQLTRNLFDLVSNVHRDGDEYVLNGRKWWTSNGMDPRSGLKIVLYFNECVKTTFFIDFGPRCFHMSKCLLGAKSVYSWERQIQRRPSTDSRQWFWWEHCCTQTTQTFYRFRMTHQE